MAFFDQQDVEYALGHHHDSRQVHGPPPSQVAVSDSVADNRSCCRSRDQGHRVADNRDAALLGRPHICHGTTDIGDWRSGKETGEEAGNQNRLHVLCSCGPESEDRSYEVRLIDLVRPGKEWIELLQNIPE